MRHEDYITTKMIGKQVTVEHLNRLIDFLNDAKSTTGDAIKFEIKANVDTVDSTCRRVILNDYTIDRTIDFLHNLLNEYTEDIEYNDNYPHLA